MWGDFKAFISRGNVIDMAVGIIVGAAFTGIVNSLVNDLLMPPLGLLLGGIDFSGHFISLTGVDYPTLKAAQDAGAATLNYGLFINAVIRFFIVAGAVFLLIRQLSRLYRKTAAAPTRQEQLLAEIRDLLRDRSAPPVSLPQQQGDEGERQ